MLLPILTLSDPLISGEGALDPMGVATISDRLAERVLPGLRARMSRPRFLTAMAVSAAVCDGMDELVAKDGVTPPYIVFEWLVVEGFARAATREDTRYTPGMLKAQAVRASGEPMRAAAYLRIPNIFGFHGIYKPLARNLGIVDEGMRLGEAMRIPHTVWSPTARLSRFDFVARDAANRDLGRRGEEFVLEFERRRLHDSGRRDLVPRIEWTSDVRGDGAGYDVQSFNPDGTARLIEVKTTGLGKYFPFNVTVNEVRCSQARADEFHLYRVFHFGPEARLYMLAGALSKSCHLDPTQYRAFVQRSE